MLRFPWDMISPVRRIHNDAWNVGSPDSVLAREWLVTNGIGGYASGTVAGIATRRYHGLLIAALPAPLGRQFLFSHLLERFRQPDGKLTQLSGVQACSQDLTAGGVNYLEEFRLEMGLPVWRFRLNGTILEKQIVFPHEQNTVYIIYRLLSGGPIRLKLLPALHNRNHDAPVSSPLPERQQIAEDEDLYEFTAASELPTLRMRVCGARTAFTIERWILPESLYVAERDRGYEPVGQLWSPGFFRADLTVDRSVALVASTEPWPVITAMNAEDVLDAERERRQRLLAAAHPAARSGTAAELVLAADQFLVKPIGRNIDAARVRAAGGEFRTVIAGYHWFTDWGRDTMISLEGLTLATGRLAEAGDILRTFAYFIKDGLIPNLFPEGENGGLYHTADATLWFFHAIDRYMQAARDETTLQALLPHLVEIAEHHLRGTHFGIRIDPEDGLLTQGADGYQLTWMDAKVDDWVVTPRRGKAVELNALWYNALGLLANWLGQYGDFDAATYWEQHAERARDSFNRRFWCEPRGHLFDVVDGEQGDDAACRPNQIFAISLSRPILEREHWESVLEVVRRELLTPVGLRTLAQRHPDYRKSYDGDRRARDAAYHQGTVWAWLIGAYVDAWMKLHPQDRQGARQLLNGFEPHLSSACIGSISEVFDAEAPYTPRGCIAQAWSVAELLRVWIKTSAES
jgi:predicted glycogen debranching enzyme